MAPLLGTPVYLGAGERAPRIAIRPAFSPVFCDITGDKIPLDLLAEGEEAFVTVTLTRWNEAVVAAIQSRPRHGLGGGGGTRGTNQFGDVGSMMLTEGLSHNLILQFPYATVKPAMAAAGLPAGYFFTNAMLEGPDEWPEQGTVARKCVATWHCLRGYSSTDGSLILYTNLLPALPPVPPN